MPDRQLPEVSAFAGLFGPTAISGVPGVSVAERTGLGLASVSIRKGRSDELARTLRDWGGLTLRPGSTVSSAGPVLFVAMGPGQWLAIGEGGGWRFARDLAAELKGVAAVCDQSSGYGVLRLSGPRLRETLAKGVPIDLDPRVFGPGDCAVTLAAHVGVILWQVDDEPTFDVAVFRSFADSFRHWLSASSAEFGITASEPR